MSSAAKRVKLDDGTHTKGMPDGNLCSHARSTVDSGDAAGTALEEQPPLCVLVKTLAGDSWNLGRLGRQTSVQQLKEQLAETSGIPLEEQLLLIGLDVLDGRQQLQQLVEDSCLTLEMQLARQHVIETGLSSEMADRMYQHAREVSQVRKRRPRWRGHVAPVFPGLASVVEVESLAFTSRHAMSDTAASDEMCLDVKYADGYRIATGGPDKHVVLFDVEQQNVVQRLSGHSHSISSVSFHPSEDIILSASLDSTARLWKCSDASNWKAAYSCAHVFRKHTAGLTDLSIHPLGLFFATASQDMSWALHDISTEQCMKQVSGHHCKGIAIHPDGLILGSLDNKLRIWDLRTFKDRAELDGDASEVGRALSFSQNGYYVAFSASCNNAVVKLCDLRKVCAIQTLDVPGHSITSIGFDPTGEYLTVVAGSVHIFSFTSRATLKHTVELNHHPTTATGAQLLTDAKTPVWLASVSVDQQLRLYHSIRE